MWKPGQIVICHTVFDPSQPIKAQIDAVEIESGNAYIQNGFLVASDTGELVPDYDVYGPDGKAVSVTAAILCGLSEKLPQARIHRPTDD